MNPTSKAQQFVNLLNSRDSYLVLDTETSGLKGEIVEISIILVLKRQPPHQVLLDTKLKPKNPIDPESIKIHHITDEMCQQSPTWPEIRPRLIEILTNTTVVTYNALFDRRAFHHTDRAWGLPTYPWKTIGTWACCMHATADLLCVGELRWWRLSKAAEKMGIKTDDITLHSSLGDTILAGRVVEFLIDFFEGKKTIS